MSILPHSFSTLHHCGNLLEIAYVGGIGHRVPASGADLFHDLQGTSEGAPFRPRSFTIDLRAPRSEPERVAAAKPRPGAGDDGDFSLEPD